MVLIRPFSKLVFGLHPSFSICLTSNNFLGVPSGKSLLNFIFPLNLNNFFNLYDNFLIEISSPNPTFIGLTSLYFLSIVKIASARSSTNKNSLLGFPVPQISTSFALLSFASANFLINAGMT